MNKYAAQSGLAPILIIFAVLIVGGISAFVVSKTVFNQPSPSNPPTPQINNQLTSPPPTPVLNPTPTPSPAPTTTVVPTPSPAKITAAGGVDTSGGLAGVEVITYLRSDKTAYFIDFKAASFANIATIYYNLNYDTDLAGTIRGVETTFVPTADQIYGYDSGKPYIRRLMLLGTCSKNVCNYDTNPRNFRLTVTVTLKDNSKSTKVQTLNYY